MKSILFLIVSLATAAAHAEPVRFPEVFSKVIDQKCTYCHSNPNKKPFDMTNYQEVMAVVVPGNLDESKVYQMMIQGKMPPQKIINMDPSFELTEDDVMLVKQWILDGALE
jgi:hypothetical protein